MGSKRKREKAEDFKKTKLKVGGKKPHAQNQTDTSFKSKSIVVPTQSISQDKSIEIKSSRNQTLKELIPQLHHYNAVARKDAIAGLRDILLKQKHIFLSSLSPVIQGMARLTIDENDQVRPNAISFFQDIFTQYGEERFKPHASFVISFVLSGMSHLVEDVRVDALKFLSALMKVTPTTIMTYESTLLSQFVLMLGGSTEARKESGVRPLKGSKEFRLELLNCFHSYLALCVQPIEEPTENGVNAQNLTVTWNSSYVTHVALSTDSDTLYDTNINTPIDIFVGSAPSERSNPFHLKIGSTLNVEASKPSVQSYKMDTLEDIKRLADAVIPSLIDIWIETAPDVFTGVTVNFTSSLSTLVKILDILDYLTLLYYTHWENETLPQEFESQQQPSVDAWSSKQFNLINKHVGRYFAYTAQCSEQSRSAKYSKLVAMDTKFATVAGRLGFPIPPASS